MSIYSNCIEQVQEYCNKNNIPLNLIAVDTLEKAKNVPCIFNNWAVFYNGDFVTNHLLRMKLFKKEISIIKVVYALKKSERDLSSSNGMNLYRGLRGCIYCGSRSKCYHMEHAFEDVEVKEMLLSFRKYFKKETIKMYVEHWFYDKILIFRLKMNLVIVRKALSLAYKYGFGFTLITKI